MSSNIIKTSATWHVKTCSPKSSWSFIGVTAECMAVYFWDMAWFSAAQVIGLRIELRTRQRRSIAPSPLSAAGHQFPTSISDLSDLFRRDSCHKNSVLHPYLATVATQLPHSPKCWGLAAEWPFLGSIRPAMAASRNRPQLQVGPADPVLGSVLVPPAMCSQKLQELQNQNLPYAMVLAKTIFLRPKTFWFCSKKV